jgi:cytochrome c oxidase cbb3-type subunit 1
MQDYNYKVVKQFAIMTVVWGIFGMLVGVIIAAQLVWPALGFDLPWLQFGRLRPLHTNAVIFAFGSCALMGLSFYIVQRTCQVRLFGDALAAFVFWDWQLVILLAAIPYRSVSPPAKNTQSLSGLSIFLSPLSGLPMRLYFSVP